jgi:predicted O-methyltransferase YrrM
MLKSTIKRALNSVGFDFHRLDPATVARLSRKVPLRLPTIGLKEIFTGEQAIKILEPETANGNVTLLELVVINTLVAKRAPRVLFEIGTFDGRASLNMIANAAHGAKLFTLDLPAAQVETTAFALDEADRQYAKKSVSGARFAGTPQEKQIVQLLGDSAQFDFSPYRGTAEVIFIDGSHAHAYVKSDTANALKIAADSAIIIWHDYTPYWDGVVDGLHELQAEGGPLKNLRQVAGTSLAVLDYSRNG